MLVYKFGTVIFDRDITEIDSVKFYKPTLSVPVEEMNVYRYGTIYFKKDITEIDSITFLKTNEISPLIVAGTITPTIVQGCSADVPAVTTVLELETLPGSLTINQGCSGKDKMTLSYSDVVNGDCPVIINRIYTIKDECNNSAAVVHQINIEDSENPIISGTLTTMTVSGSSVASAPQAALSVSALELLPGSIKINDDCTSKTNLKVNYTDELNGICPIVINRTYTIKDACQNSTPVVQQIIIEPITPITTVAIEYIRGGTFIMGSPDTEVKLPDGNTKNDETQHQVTLTSFYISKYEVTNAEYAAFLNKLNIGADAIYRKGQFPDKELISYTQETRFEPWGVHFSNGRWIPYPGYENHPVPFVTWYGAVEYANYAGGRLPTEAEWEYACRAGTNTPFNTGNCLTSSQANYDWRYPYNGCPINGLFTGWHTEKVNLYQPNAWGLYNMHGNISEWVSDWYGQYPNIIQTDPTGSVTGSERVVRGGTNSNVAHACRSAYRYPRPPGYASSTIGFRVAFPCMSYN